MKEPDNKVFMPNLGDAPYECWAKKPRSGASAALHPVGSPMLKVA